MNKKIRTIFALLFAVTAMSIPSHGQDITGRNFFALENQAGVSGAKNIILFIGDGMGYQNEVALSRYLYGNDDGLVWMDFPYSGYVTTWDIDTYNRYASNAGASLYSEDRFTPSYGYDPERGGEKPYGHGEIPEYNYFFSSLPTAGGGEDTYAYPSTDSAAAATAIATGHKTDSGNISWKSGDPDGGELISIAELYMSRLGSAIGTVTSVEFSHATTGPFVAHNVYRGNPGQIANEIINEFRPDVVIGGGHPDWESGYISWSAYNTVKNSDEVEFVERVDGVNGGESLLEAAERAVSGGKRLFGLYGNSSGYFDSYEALDTPGSPGFIRNPDSPTLAEGVEAALMVLSEDDDGFFLVVEQGDIDWANHYRNYHWMINAMYDLELAVGKAVEYVERPGDDIDWSNTLLLVTADHVTGALRMSDEIISGAGDLPEMTGSRYHYEFPGGEARYITTVHTNEPVMLYAKGPGSILRIIRENYEGSWYPGTRLIDNTQLFDIMADFGGIEF